MNNGIEYDRILVIAAHPDDIDFTIAGSVALCARAGKTVGYCIATSGDKGFDEDLPVEERMRIREEEQRAAAAVVCVEEVHFLRKPDGELRNTPGLRRAIVAVIRKFKPDVLITSYPSRALAGGELSTGHPDHIAAGEAALSAVFPSARDRLTFPELIGGGLEPHKVKEVLIMSRGYGANRWIEVTDTIETSIEALKQHRSQVSPESAETALPRSRREAGKAKGILYAESFKSFRFG